MRRFRFSIFDNMAAMEPHGSAQDHFVLMLHDRLVKLETELHELKPAPPDGRVSVLGSCRASDTGAVFVRLKAAVSVDLDAWCDSLMFRLGERDAHARFDAWACQHWSLGQAERPYIVECLLERSGGGPLDVVRVAHAALDACATADPEARVDACAVTCAAWFAECIRSAAAASETAVLRSWDPVARAMTCQDINSTDETGVATPKETAVWLMLHGFLASQTERTEVWHPHAPSASKAAADLVAALAAAL